MIIPEINISIKHNLNPITATLVPSSAVKVKLAPRVCLRIHTIVTPGAGV